MHLDDFALFLDWVLGGRLREQPLSMVHPWSMVHGRSMVHGPWSMAHPWCMVDPWSMVHLQSMAQDEDATILRLSGRIFEVHLDDFVVLLDVFWMGFWVVD